VVRLARPDRCAAGGLDKVSRDIGEVMKYPEVVTRFRQQGVTPATTSPSRMTEILRADEARFGKLFDRSR